VKAAYYYEPGVIQVEEVDIPEIKENEMLLRIRAASICGTDMRIFKHGHFKIPSGERRVLGHEFAGEIVKVGSLVEGFHEGMQVAVPPNISCGVCELCRDGYNNMCPDYEAFGISIDGGFQEYMRIPNLAICDGNVFPIPDHLSYREAALVEPLSCVYNSLRSVNTTYQDIVLVFGAGPIGIMHMLLNKIAGAKKVMVADIRDDRLENIKALGADVTINSVEKDLETTVMQETDGRGADVIITAVSLPEIQNFFGGLGKGILVPIDTNRIHYKGLKLLGTTGSTHSDFFKSLNLVSEGRIQLEQLITATYSLEEIEGAFDHAFSAEGLKTSILFEDE
jgi:threonine dehydrogenase-like Zn-dependent dehydrogenase